MLQLDHLNIVPLLGICLHPTSLVLSLAPLGALNGLLKDYKRSGVRLSLKALQRIVLQVAQVVIVAYCLVLAFFLLFCILSLRQFFFSFNSIFHYLYYSTNSAINSLWKKSILDSPSKLTTNTKKEKEKKENQYKASDYLDSTDPSLGETLVDDIASFLQKANANNRNENSTVDKQQ